MSDPRPDPSSISSDAPTSPGQPTCDSELADLLLRLERGDGSAHEPMAARYYPRVEEMVRMQLRRTFRHRHRWMYAAFSTCDIVHDIFVKLLENPAAFAALKERTDQALLAYLARTVHHQLLDVVRHEERACRDVRRRSDESPSDVVEQPLPHETPSHLVAILDHLRIYREVLDSMEPRQRELLVLRLEEQLEFADIARRLRFASADTARRAFRQAQSRMATRLKARGVGTGSNA